MEKKESESEKWARLADRAEDEGHRTLAKELRERAREAKARGE